VSATQAAVDAAIAREHELLAFAAAILKILEPAKKGPSTIEESVAFQSAFNQGMRSGIRVGESVAAATNHAISEQRRQEASAASPDPGYWPGYL